MLNAWEMECLKKADQCWCKVMEHWLDQEDSPYPVTWRGLFMLLEDAEYSQVAIELDIALRSRIQPTTPPTTSTGACEETIQSTAKTTSDHLTDKYDND